MSVAPASAKLRERVVEDGDELPFGDFCFACGNATQGSSYCSPECRQADVLHAEPSPDFSPYLSAVPPLVPSAKSVCSTPPSSATNSPSPLSGIPHELSDPPSLDLPPPKHKFDYGAQSLPSTAMRFPATWSINYQPDPLSSPVVGPVDAAQTKQKDLSYRRKPGKPASTVPSPLYFRQKALAVHSSPALNPTSPSTRSPFLGFDGSGAHIHEDDITALTLPQRRDSVPVPPSSVPPQSHCGRPGCVGAVKRPKVDPVSAGNKSGRRQSWQAAATVSQGLKALTPLETSEDVLLSPRIRALRTGRSLSDEGSTMSTLKSPVGAGALEGSCDGDSSDDAHSAFACYLFSHLADPAGTPEPRGRTTSVDQQLEEQKRSQSVDAVLAARSSTGVDSISSPAPPTPGRPTRFLFSRGQAAVRSDPLLEPFTPIEPEPAEEEQVPPADDEQAEEDHTFTIPSHLSGRNRDRDWTIRASGLSSSLVTRGRSKLTPGHFIAATTDSPSTSVGISPFPSPPPSPPTAGRGRSQSTRRLSNAGFDDERERGRYPVVDDQGSGTPDPRGRSKLRGMGAVKRSMSPSVRKESESRSRSRSRSSRPRASHSRGRDAREGEGRGRGRTRERTVEEETEVFSEEERERGRGRDSRSRSKSLLARGRGHEVVYSMAAYGHFDSSEDER
ncbi:hypothetical protein JCM1841_002884 [Sporobolomyces salmonicolor]